MLEIFNSSLMIVPLIAFGAILTQQLYAWKNRRRRVGAEIGIALSVMLWAASFFVLFRGDYTATSIGVTLLLLLAQVPVFLIISKHRKCPECGKPIYDRYQFCQNCGYGVTGVKRHSVPVVIVWDRTSRIACLPTVFGGLFLMGFGVTVLVVSLLNSPAQSTGIYLTPTPIPVINVVTALQNLPRGFRFPDSLNQLSSLVGYIPWPYYAAPFNAVYSLDEVLGKVALTDMYREQPISSMMVGDGLFEPNQITDNESAVLPRGSIIYDQPVQGILYGANPVDVWVFNANVGQTVTFGVMADDGDFQPNLMIWAERSEAWIDGKWTKRGTITTVTVTFDQTDLYDVMVGLEPPVREDSHVSGLYELTVIQGPSEPPLFGPWPPHPTPSF